jgi:predicted TIM-barrel fold metal-dependent hydrolase
VHHHLVPPKLLEALRKANLGSQLLYSWTPQKSLDDMETSRIDVSMLSVSMPAVSFLPRGEARHMARECNDYTARLLADHPGRFGSLATMPMPYIDDTLEEIAYAFDVLRMDGVCLMTSYANVWLGSPIFDAVMDELHRRRAVTFVHPNLPDCCANTLDSVPPSVIEYGTDTARAITNLIFTGTSIRCPGISFIFSHAGGSAPMFVDRYVNLSRSGRVGAKFTGDKVLSELARFHYDTALAANAPAMAAITRVAPISQILLGTDFPLRPSEHQVAALQKLFRPDEFAQVERENALRLYPRLRAI